MCRINFTELALKEGGVLSDNNHLLVEVNGDIVEKKYCPHCGEWHLLSDFHANASSKDGLHGWCKDCATEYGKLRRAMKKAAIIDESDTPNEEEVLFEGELAEDNDCIEKAMENLSSIRLRDIEQQSEIKRLKAELQGLKGREIDLESLSEREIEKVLKSNMIPPRLLFEAIARIEDRYTFFASDNVSGQTYPIKIESSVA